MRSLLASLIAVALAFPSTAQSAVINRKLSGPMVGEARALVVQNGRVVYMANQDDPQLVEVYGVPADGSAPPVKLNGPLVIGGDVTGIALSPDGSTALYTADAETNNTEELFSVPSDGSAAPVKLNAPLIDPSGISVFRISPDGTQVMYTAHHEGTGGTVLYSVPIHGGTPVSFLSPVTTAFEITPDSTRVVFFSGRLRSAPIDGSAPPIELDQFNGSSDFSITPDSAWVVWRIGNELFSVPVTGGATQHLSGPFVAGRRISAFAIAPAVNGTRVVYLADRFEDDRFVLSSVPVGGGFDPTIVLNGPLVAPGSDVLDFRVSPDGEHVVYLADQDVDGLERLYHVHVEGIEPAVQLSAADLDDASFEVAPGGAHVVVSRDGLLASLPTTGGSFQPLSNSSTEFLFAFAGRRIVHVESERLMLTSITSGTSVPLGPEPAGSVHEFAVDGPLVVYLADQDELGVDEIYSSTIDHAGPVEQAPPTQTRFVLR